MMKKILILGPRQNKYDLTKTGGITILLELLLEELDRRNIPYVVIDTLVDNNGGKVMTLLKSYYRLIRYIGGTSHISLQGSENVMIFLAPVAILLSKLLGKRVSMRVFAGRINNIYERNLLYRTVIKFVLCHIDVIFFETKYLVDYFKKFNPHTYWFPNVRRYKAVKKKDLGFRHRFIYLGTINRDKGIDVICEVAPKLPDGYVFDLYGPITEDKYSQEYFDQKGISYRGVIRPEKVLEIIQKYDVLVLPSYSEGYPGVIIEAFMAGLPVIATRLEGIMEMVEDGYNGILIDPGDSEALYRAIISIDSHNYKKLHLNAKDSFRFYNSTERTDYFLKRIGYE